MAEANAREESFFEWASHVVTASLDKVREVDQKSWDAVMKDGFLAAAARQGADEMGMALRAFPESIQAFEPGTLWSPTQGEIAEDRKPDRLPTPSEIASDDRPYQPEHSHGHERGR